VPTVFEYKSSRIFKLLEGIFSNVQHVDMVFLASQGINVRLLYLTSSAFTVNDVTCIHFTPGFFINAFIVNDIVLIFLLLAF